MDESHASHGAVDDPRLRAHRPAARAQPAREERVERRVALERQPGLVHVDVVRPDVGAEEPLQHDGRKVPARTPPGTRLRAGDGPSVAASRSTRERTPDMGVMLARKVADTAEPEACAS